MLSVPQIARVQDKNLADALQRIVDHVNRASTTIRIDPNGAYPTPKQVAGISVLGGTGIADIMITDNSIIGSGVLEPITYWVEYSTDPNFADPLPYQVALIGTRNARLAVPLLKLYFRTYSQYFGSQPSKPTVFGGSSPKQVDCSTGAAPPQQGAQGSGSNAAGRPGTGYGVLARLPL